MNAPVLLVLADSLAFHGPTRAEPANEPRLWPNVAASLLGGRAELLAGYGWTARHAWRALTHDPRIWSVMPTVDALVLGVGGMDTLPSPLPTALRELIPALRPDSVRRVVRRGYLAAQPALARTFARVLPGGGPVALPPALSVRYLESCRRAVTAIRPGIPVALMLPGVHRAPAYGYVHPGRPAAVRAMRQWASVVDVRTLDVSCLISDHIRSGQGNPDGIHYGWAGHQLVGRALAALLAPAVGYALGAGRDDGERMLGRDLGRD
ncbi:MAG: SGNH/GDSL hydrolase family protein [Pseudonocardia sp.]|nr:SGNH/GDSL hydrolase family protein [Pseudonocardia sp.]